MKLIQKIYHKILPHKLSNILDKLLDKYYFPHKEAWLYLVFGALTTLVNVLSYIFLTRVCGIETEFASDNIILKIFLNVANDIAWLISVIFAYVTNKIIVFEVKKNKNFFTFFVEMLSFFAARIVTLIMENIILYIFVDILSFNDLVIKIAATVLVIIANYVFSKLFIFRKKSDGGSDNEHNS